MAGAWHIFFHPRASARRLEELQQEAREAQERADLLESELSSERAALQQAREEQAELAKRQRLLGEKLTRAEAEAARLREKMASEASVYDLQQKQIDEIQEQFRQVEKMYASYERRISSLKEKLRDARAALTSLGKQRDDELQELDPSECRRPRPAQEPSPPPPEEADWYQALPPGQVL